MFRDSNTLYRNEFVEPVSPPVLPEDRVRFRRIWEPRRRGTGRGALPATSSGPTTNTTNTTTNTGKQLILEVTTRTSLVNVDSRDRDRLAYPSSANFKVATGRTFSNIVKVALVGTEIPRLNNVVTVYNNILRWINFEDVGIGFPVYEVTVRSGYYTAVTLKAALESTLNSGIMRRTSGVPHYFIVEIDAESGYSGFTSLLSQKVAQNMIQTVAGSSIVTVTQPNHGYTAGEKVYLVNVTDYVGGIPPSVLTNSFYLTAVTDGSFSFDCLSVASETSAGGNMGVLCGIEAPFQFVLADFSDSFMTRLGFELGNSAELIPPVTGFLMSPTFLQIESVSLGWPVTITTTTPHCLRPGERFQLPGAVVTPALERLDSGDGFSVSAIVDETTFETYWSLTKGTGPAIFSSFDWTQAQVVTRRVTVNYPNHGFNRVIDIQAGPDFSEVIISTMSAHGLAVGTSVFLNETNSQPSLDGVWTVHRVVDTETFSILLGVETQGITGYKGIFTTDQDFYLYNCEAFAGLMLGMINGRKVTVTDIMDENSFAFNLVHGFPTVNLGGGGSQTEISSKVHGFRARQDNSGTPGSLDLRGDSYVFLCCGTLGATMSTGSDVKNVFGKLQLVEILAGDISFNCFSSTALVYPTPLTRLDELQLTLMTSKNVLVDTNGLDYSVTFEITELAALTRNSSDNPFPTSRIISASHQ